MIVQNLMVDCLEDFSFGCEARDECEVAREPEVYKEGTRLGIHAGGEHYVNDELLLLKVVSVVNDSVVQNLSYEADWRLSTVFIYIRHIEVVHEIDESLAWWWTECSSSTLVNP